MSLLGVDVGTSGARAVAFDESLRELAVCSVPLRERGADDRAELDPFDVLDAVTTAIRAVNARAAVRADPVTALAVAVLGEATVALDAAGRPLDAIPLAADRRAVAELGRLVAKVPEERLRSRGGQPVHPMFTIATWMWWRGNAAWWPEARGLRCVGDFLAEYLTGESSIDLSMASRTLAFDQFARGWSDEVLTAAGIDIGLLAAPVAAGTVLGRVRPETAESLGFVGTPLVAAGAHDQACAAFGGGVADGESVLSLGTTECLTSTWPGRPGGLIDGGYAAYPVDATARWLSLAGIPAGGSALRWLARLTGHAGDVAGLVAQAECHPNPSRALCQPHFLGSGTIENDARSRAAFLGLDLAATPADLVLALWEASGFEVARSLAVLGRVRGAADRILRVVGGGAVSRRGLQARADAAGLPVVHIPGHATARGAAILAGVGEGRWVRPEDAAPLLPRSADINPDPAHAGFFMRRRAQHDGMSRSLSGCDLVPPALPDPSEGV